MSERDSVSPGRPVRVTTALLGLLAGWLATFSWSGMVTRPELFLVPALALGLLVVLVGQLVRRQVPRFPAYAVAIGQLLTALVGLNAVVAPALSRWRVLPTPASVGEVVHAIRNGAASLNYYAAPVSANTFDTRALLLAIALLVVLAIDLIVMWWRRAPLVALPLLLVLSVPVSILQEALALPVFVGTALLFVWLLAAAEPEPATARPSGQRQPRPADRVVWAVGLGGVLVALLVAPAVPVAHLLDRGPATSVSDDGAGGGDFSVTSVDPFIRLRRDLVQQTHTPMVFARTQAPRTSYLRTTVLDEFTSSGWGASTRQLPAANAADGRFPPPPGLGPQVSGRDDRWDLELAPDFFTAWLPIPFPLRSLDVEGSWRYDSRTLDVTMVSPVATSALRYSAVAFTPSLDADALRSTVSAPGKVQVPNTQVPSDLPPIIEQQARTVTKGADNTFERAVALQDWFRSKGGFRYSLEQRPGSGMDLLAHFVTDDRVGYCEQYAAAMAAMGRTLGIPSRVVVGFLDGTSEPDGRVLYTSDDRHAWTEMYFSGVGWVRFEPTPAQRSGASPPWTRIDSSEAAPPTPSRPAERTRRAQPLPESSGQRDNTGAGFAWRPLAGLVLLGLVAALPAGVRREQRRRRLRAHERQALNEGAWAELRATAVDAGVGWPDGRSPREQARSLVAQVPAARRRLQPIEGLLGEVERSRYGPPGTSAATLSTEERRRTVQTVHELRGALLDATRKQRGWRYRLWPASVWRRDGRSR